MAWFASSNLPYQVKQQHYIYRWVRKKNSGWRLLESPKYQLREIQRIILRELLDHVPPHECAHGFRAAHSTLTHAAVHVNQPVVIGMDLRDFFLSVGGARIDALLQTLGYRQSTARTLTALCTNRINGRHLAAIRGLDDYETLSLSCDHRDRYQQPHLPQGAPSSPALANLCTFRLDLRLDRAAQAAGANYTRYADDLTFSGPQSFYRGARQFCALVASICAAEGFAINHRKTRIHGQGRQQRVTGIVVNKTMNWPRAEYDALKATLYNCIRFGPDSQNRTNNSQYRAHLLGKIQYVAQINPARGEKLRRLYQKIDW